jgi:polyribonucleotide 5'-hydroxyl-kinase
LGRTPVFVDLDCGQGCVSIPGSLGAVVVERPADVEDGFSLVAPIVYHFGHTGPAGNVTLYNMIINTLSQSVKLKMESDSKVKYSGVIINTCGWVKSHGYQAIIKAAQDFNVDLIAVLDQERLYNELVRDVSNTVKVCNETVLKKF